MSRWVVGGISLVAGAAILAGVVALVPPVRGWVVGMLVGEVK